MGANDQRDIPTDRIESAVSKAMRRSGEHSQLDRIEDGVEALAEKIIAIDKRLIEGSAKMEVHEEKIGELRKVVYGTIGLVVLGVLGAAGTALVWVIQKGGSA
jgi:hypothetical protein